MDKRSSQASVRSLKESGIKRKPKPKIPISYVMKKIGLTKADIKPLGKRDIRRFRNNIPETFLDHKELYVKTKIDRYNKHR